ncbi:MAG: hypothetical protein J6M43_02025 [Neisseriaceae bacterium]|nr:hypothetical protein [Neisseriaceae bacterium]
MPTKTTAVGGQLVAHAVQTISGNLKGKKQRLSALLVGCLPTLRCLSVQFN